MRAITFSFALTFFVSMSLIAGAPNRRPSAVSECNKGNAAACKELKQAILQSITSSNLDPESRKVLHRIVSEWKAEK